MTDLGSISAVSMRRRLREGDLTSLELTEHHLDRIEARNDRTNAYIHVAPERAREAAREADERLAVGAGEDAPLLGLPVAIKDLQPVAGLPTRFGSAAFADNVAEESAVLAERLEAAGGVTLGMTNACEFGHKGTTDNVHFGPTATPFDTDYNAGGSSGGAAAAVAEGLAPLAQGGDGGGSIRIPAACCNVFGLKPSFGRVPQDGEPNAFNEHTPFVGRGPLTRTVADAALMLEVLAGPFPGDPFSLPPDDTDYLNAAERGSDGDLSGVSVACSPDLGLFPLTDGVRAAYHDAVAGLRETGASVTGVELTIDHALGDVFEAWRTTWADIYAGLAENLSADGVDLIGDHREALSPEFAALIEQGRAQSAIDLKRADMVRSDVFRAIQRVLGEHDLLVTPTLTRPPVENGENTVGPATVEGVEVGVPIGWALTYPFNLTGHPVASLPAGLVGGLPVGVQFVGRRHADATVLEASAAFEAVRPWGDAYPAK